MNKLNRNTLNIEEFKKGQIVINPKTKERQLDLFKYLDKNGITWADRVRLLPYDMEIFWDNCYRFDNMGIVTSNLDFYYDDEYYDIYGWEIAEDEISVISFERIERTEFTKKIYISHPYSGLEENKRDVEEKVKRLVKEYPNYIFISPVHTFGYLYNSYPYYISIDLCIELLKTCDEMWCIDNNFVNSKMVEREYCLNHDIPIRLVEV